ncbi:serine hydrolase domain-containing protein [Phnomibacter sp. MR]|uniref:serine hydrolase domain-containing protein n=1 Tax=Phnomibacter sp. MR TaxID=3042318 RepID=UPI003A7F85B9
MSKILFSCGLLLLQLSTTAQNPIDSIVNAYHKQQDFSGVVLMATAGKLQYQSAKGLANRSFQVPIQTDTRFKIASITKTFTAVLILQLMDKGQLKLDATMGQYLPNYTGEAKDKVTIRQLLTYSSGIPNCEGNTGIAVYQSPNTVDGFIQQHCSGKLEFAPGSQFNYNNADYIILGSIIEHITGQSFAQNLQENILQPLNMQHTQMLRSKDVIPMLASTYNKDDSTGAMYADDPMYIENYFAAGAMYSTAADLLRFDQGIFTHQLLKPATVELMLTPNPNLYGVAIGFWVYQQEINQKPYTLANRQGSIWGANANWIHVLHENETVIVLSNSNTCNLPEMTNALLQASLR